MKVLLRIREAGLFPQLPNSCESARGPSHAPLFFLFGNLGNPLGQHSSNPPGNPVEMDGKARRAGFMCQASVTCVVDPPEVTRGV